MVIRNYLRGLPKLLYITKMVAKDGMTQTDTVSTHSAIVYPHMIIDFSFRILQGPRSWSVYPFVRPSRILKRIATCPTETESNYIQTIYEHERVGK